MISNDHFDCQGEFHSALVIKIFRNVGVGKLIYIYSIEGIIQMGAKKLRQVSSFVHF